MDYINCYTKGELIEIIKEKDEMIEGLELEIHHLELELVDLMKQLEGDGD
ncbi:MAG: hypothetical protein ACOCZ5_02665 [bacterium]